MIRRQVVRKMTTDIPTTNVVFSINKIWNAFLGNIKVQVRIALVWRLKALSFAC